IDREPTQLFSGDPHDRNAVERTNARRVHLFEHRSAILGVTARFGVLCILREERFGDCERTSVVSVREAMRRYGVGIVEGGDGFLGCLASDEIERRTVWWRIRGA